MILGATVVTVTSTLAPLRTRAARVERMPGGVALTGAGFAWMGARVGRRGRAMLAEARGRRGDASGLTDDGLDHHVHGSCRRFQGPDHRTYASRRKFQGPDHRTYAWRRKFQGPDHRFHGRSLGFDGPEGQFDGQELGTYASKRKFDGPEDQHLPQLRGVAGPPGSRRPLLKSRVRLHLSLSCR